MKNLIVYGSTGSIGKNTLEVVDAFPDEFSVSVLSTNTSIELLQTQIKKYNPKYAVITNKSAAKKFISNYTGNTKILEGSEGLIEALKITDYDILLNAVVGFAGLSSTIQAIKSGKRIALANKETLVVAGQIVNNLIKKHNAEMIPVDSEHSAIFQCLVGENKNEINKLIITASGGPFLNLDIHKLETVNVDDALNHPNWKMGNKISIDSATMMNKGLEVIEAHWLFDLPSERIDVVVHPQSVIHSMIEFVDMSIKAQLSLPDMKLPIQYALTYPKRFPSKFVETNFFEIQNLTFFKPDLETFKCLKLAFDSLEQAGNTSCILNAANEIAVEWFLDRKIKFLDISNVIENALDNIDKISRPDIESIFETDRQTREYLRNNIGVFCK